MEKKGQYRSILKGASIAYNRRKFSEAKKTTHGTDEYLTHTKKL